MEVNVLGVCFQLGCLLVNGLRLANEMEQLVALRDRVWGILRKPGCQQRRLEAGLERVVGQVQLAEGGQHGQQRVRRARTLRKVSQAGSCSCRQQVTYL